MMIQDMSKAGILEALSPSLPSSGEPCTNDSCYKNVIENEVDVPSDVKKKEVLKGSDTLRLYGVQSQ